MQLVVVADTIWFSVQNISDQGWNNYFDVWQPDKLSPSPVVWQTGSKSLHQQRLLLERTKYWKALEKLLWTISELLKGYNAILSKWTCTVVEKSEKEILPSLSWSILLRVMSIRSWNATDLPQKPSPLSSWSPTHHCNTCHHHPYHLDPVLLPVLVSGTAFHHTTLFIHDQII